MIRIKCSNLKCTSPTNSFDWDESKHIQRGGSIAQPYEEGAVRIIAVCPYCVTENAVWVKKAKKNDVLTRGGKPQ